MKQIIRRTAALVLGLMLGAVSWAGLESVTHISDLNASWPLGSDLASTSDDHIRNIKTALKNDFPNVNAAVNPTPAQFNQLTSDTFTSAVTAPSVTVNSSSVPANGIYLPSANTLGITSNSTQRGTINSTGDWTINAPSSGTALTVSAAAAATAVAVSGTTAPAVSLSGVNGLLRLQNDQAFVDFYNTAGSTRSGFIQFNASSASLVEVDISQDLRIRTGGTTDRMIVDAAGGVRFVSTGTTANPSTGTQVIINGGNSGQIVQSNSSAGADAKVWDSFTDSSGILHYRAANDANSSATDWLNVTRSGQTPTAIKGYGPTATGVVDMTPDTGTFTSTMTGGTTSPTCTSRWTRVGNLVMLEICAVIATSNSTAFTYTGLPAAVQPTVTQHLPVAAGSYENNGATLPNGVEVVVTASSGTITFWLNGSATGWTSINGKGITSVNTVSYLLN